MKFVIGYDHTAARLANVVISHLESRGFDVVDMCGANEEPFEYPLIAYKVARVVASGSVDSGILICGTGVGVSITANKVRGIRAVVCSEAYSARLSKQHNNSNILCFGARVVGDDVAKMIVDAWIDAGAEGGRHADRVKMITSIEESGSLD